MRRKQEGRIIYVFKYDAKAEKIAYYFLLAEEDMRRCIERSKPLIELPLKKDYMKDLIEMTKAYGEIIERTRTYIVGGFRNEDDYKRHLLFVLMVSDLKTYNKDIAEEGMWLAGWLNPIFVNYLASIAVDRYMSGDDVERILSVGRALRVLYGVGE